MEKRQFSEVLSFFDNDRAGEKGLGPLQEQFLVEQQDFYYSCKDVNDYGSLTIFAKDTLLVSSDGEAIRRDGRSRRMTSSPDGNNAKIVKEP